MQRTIRSLTALTLTLTALLPAAGQPHVVKQALDSAWILMGRTIGLNIEMLSTGRPDGRLELPAEMFPSEVEIRDPGRDTLIDLGNDRWQMQRQVTLQAFDSGTYVIPPAMYITPAGDTLISDVLPLKVVPVAVDSLTTINPYAPTIEMELRWYDRLPDWLVDWGWWLILLVIALGAVGTWAYRRWFRALPEEEKKPKRAPEPPDQVALKHLDELRNEHLWESGHEREFYTRLTDILRVYLRDRFGINAMEMTSSEIRRALEAKRETILTRPLMSQVLEMADFVKFAKARPLPDDNNRSMAQARQFVENTRPMPEPTA